MEFRWWGRFNTGPAIRDFYRGEGANLIGSYRKIPVRNCNALTDKGKNSYKR